MKHFLFLFLLSTIVLAASEEESDTPADFSPTKDMIADRYWAGAYLMYDCEEGHWVCVLKEDFKSCEEKRAKATKAREKFLPCAPIGEFPTKRSCFQRELYLTGQAFGHRFCLLDELKKEEIE